MLSERDTGRIVELKPDDIVHEIAVIYDVKSLNEGSLLGVVVADDQVFAYYTSSDDNRIARTEGRYTCLVVQSCKLAVGGFFSDMGDHNQAQPRKKIGMNFRKFMPI